MKVLDIALEAEGEEVTGNAAILKPLIHKGATSVQIQTVSDDQKKGYSVTWVHQGESYEMRLVKFVKQAEAGPLKPHGS